MLTSAFQTRTIFPIQTVTRFAKPSREPARTPKEVAYIITDKKQLGAGLASLIEANGVRALWFTSIAEYLAHQHPNVPSCVFLSQHFSRTPTVDMLDVIASSIMPPLILLSDETDIPSCVRAIREGAHDFITLPLVSSYLLHALRTAIRKDEAAFAQRYEHECLQKRWKSLTSRETEVMRYVVDGFLNKQTAYEMKITENTVQVHRGRVMRKMQADSFAALVRMALKLAERGENSLLRIAPGSLATVAAHPGFSVHAMLRA